MYRKEIQLKFEDFVFPFGDLDPENEWVKLAKLVPWETVEREYLQSFPGLRSRYSAHICHTGDGVRL